MKKIISILLSLLIVASATATALAFTPADGTYSADAWWEGGTGKAGIISPVSVTVNNGNITAKIVLTSSNYTWIETQGLHFNNENPGGKSTFTIPVPAFDTPFPISAETTAMSEPHVIDYSVTVSSSGIPEKNEIINKPAPETSTDKNSSATRQETEAKKPAKKAVEKSKSDDNGKAAEEAVKKAESENKVKTKTEDKNAVSIKNEYSTSTSVSEADLKKYKGKELHIETSKGSIFINKDITEYLINHGKGGLTFVLKENELNKESSDNMIGSYTFLIKDYDEKDVLKDMGSEYGKGISIKIPFKTEKEINAEIVKGETREECDFTYENEIFKFKTDKSCEINIFETRNSGNGTNIILIAAGIIVAVAVISVVVIKRRKR